MSEPTFYQVNCRMYDSAGRYQCDMVHNLDIISIDGVPFTPTSEMDARMEEMQQIILQMNGRIDQLTETVNALVSGRSRDSDTSGQ